MKVTALKTHQITTKDQDILKILDQYIPKLEEGSVVAVTSKIVSITEGSLVKTGSIDKDELIKQQSEYYIPRAENKYNVSLTITRKNLVASAGIDESNASGYFILWPKDPQITANKIRKFLRKKFNLKKLGVIITDSRTVPFRWGVTAMAIAYSGLVPLKDYIGKKDIFGRKFKFEKLSLIDALATSAAMVMGEGHEQTPLAVISELPFIKFVSYNPAIKELDSLVIDMESDLYSPLIVSAPWEKGGKSN